MDTTVDRRATSVAIRRARTYSRAVEESRPLVELVMENDIRIARSELWKHALVPSSDRRTKRQSLADRNTLFLASRYATDSIISDWCILDVA